MNFTQQNIKMIKIILIMLFIIFLIGVAVHIIFVSTVNEDEN